MGSTFMGLETARRGLTTQQSALYTTGHNISNANTVGYSRQRVNMEATLGYPDTGLNAPKYLVILVQVYRRSLFNVFVTNLLIVNIVKRRVN